MFTSHARECGYDRIKGFGNHQNGQPWIRSGVDQQSTLNGTRE